MPTDSLCALAADRRIPTREHIRFDDGGGANYPPPTDWRLSRHVAALLFGDRGLEPLRKASVPAVRSAGSHEPPEPVSVSDLVEQLRILLGRAPSIPNASPAYLGLTALVQRSRDERFVSDYLSRIVRRVFRDAPEHRTPPVQRGLSQTSAERKAAQRTRERTEAQRVARDALVALLEDDALPHGERILAGDLYARAQRHMPRGLMEPGPRTFYAVADAILGERVRGAKGARFYRIPSPQESEESPVNAADYRALADAIREEADARAYRNYEVERELALLERQHAAYASGDVRAALSLQRDRMGNVIDASSRFARASAAA